MLDRLIWYANRLRVMPAGEVLLRARRAVEQLVERRRLANGWQPGTGTRVQRTRPLLGSGDGPVESWKACFTVDTESLERLMAGEVTFFGKTYAVGPSPDWHRDPATGTSAPVSYGKTINYRNEQTVGNIKTLWELSRHQHLVPLAVGYAVTGDERYRDRVVSQIESWIEANPYGYGVHWCSSLEVALRVIAWCMVHSLLALRDSAGLLGAARSPELIERSLFQHGYFIRHFFSRHSSANNHLIGELVGLWCLARVFDFGAESAAWSDLAKSELEQEVVNQVHADGVAKEQAVHYQLEVMEYYLFAWCIGQATRMPLGPVVLERLFSMLDFLRAITPPGGEPPQIGDSDEGTVNRFRAGPLEEAHRELMNTLAQVFSAAVPQPENDSACEKGFWYRQIAESQGATGVKLPPEQRKPVRVFADGGYAVLNANGVQAVFDAGPLGYPSIAAHGHADALSFCLARDGQWWVVDPGTYSYHGEPEHRAYFRGTMAHNTVRIDGRDQSQSGGAFLWTRHAAAHLVGGGEGENGTLWTEGYHDGYSALGIRHRRRLECGTDQRMYITDTFEGAPRKGVPASIQFHFAPEAEAQIDGQQCTVRIPGAGKRLVVELDPACQWHLCRGGDDPILGWYSPGLGRKTPCWTLYGTFSLGPGGMTPVTTELAFAALD